MSTLYIKTISFQTLKNNFFVFLPAYFSIMILVNVPNPILNFILSNLDVVHAHLVISLLQQTIYLGLLNQNKYFLIIQKTTTISIKLSEQPSWYV